MHTIVLDRKNVVPNSNNSRLVYKMTSKHLEGAEIALGAAYIYYSWQNINAQPLQNNTFVFIWPESTVNSGQEKRFTIVFDDGLYEISDLNSFFQQFCIANDLYLINQDGDHVYYMQMQVNPTRYATQINLYGVPTELPEGWTNPGNFPFATNANQVPGIEIPSKFDEILGGPMLATGGNYTANPSNSFPVNTIAMGHVCLVSTVAPNVQPNGVVYVNCNLVQNSYATPSQFMYPIAAKVGFGELVVVEPSEYAYNKVIVGTQSEIVVSLTSSDGSPIKIMDPNMTFVLVIRDHADRIVNTGHSGTFGTTHSESTKRYGQHPGFSSNNGHALLHHSKA